MATFAAIDKVEIHVLVDNATDSLSSVSGHAESEFALLDRQGMHELSGDMLCCACHGLSLLITATRGNQSHTELGARAVGGSLSDASVVNVSVTGLPSSSLAAQVMALSLGAIAARAHRAPSPASAKAVVEKEPEAFLVRAQADAVQVFTGQTGAGRPTHRRE